MKARKQLVYSLDDLKVVAQELAKMLEKVSIMTFTGSLGAGKTTLVREVLKASGVIDMITSPTFTYVNIYKNQRGRTFYHFDLYRIESLEDFVAAGFNEYLYASDSAVLIEWPELIMPLLTHDVCQVAIEYHENPEQRVLHVMCK
ncbi:MAG: tRNA (adenosine(37)-N6)-threonylcarbamoyltransferase complex ATPase subunit type 1 TsaE [bacterium]|nr:tRNA (adenosine(37)-N6)-threonylcarbamoyltransferase complex ATPase subunit type 1 TsaE [bacterium]